jgi:hypothetical protein
MALQRGVWIDGGDPAYHVLADALVTLVLFDVRDPRLNPTYIADVLTKVERVGLFVCSQGEGWPDAKTTSPADWAKFAYQKIQALAGPMGEQGKSIRACLNCETHDVQWILRMFSAWRRHSPHRITVWSMEANQADLFEDHALELRGRSIIAGPQCYVVVPGDPMARVESGHEVAAWSKIMGSADRVAPFLDGAKLGHWWEGIAFTQGRLIGAQ